MMDVTWSMVFYYLLFFAVLFGLMVGSFLNVVIYRVPAGLSVVKPASRCPTCETPIRWYDNIPVVSWLLLRGKCRSCKAPISPRYAIVEGFVGLLAGVVWWQIAHGMTELPIETVVDLPQLGVVFLLRFVFVSLLVVIAMVDLDHFIIPHAFTIPGMVLGLASPWILQWMFGIPDYLRLWPPVTPFMSLAGFLFGGLAVILIFHVYFALRGIEGLGGGDVTLMAMVGAWLGPPAVVFVFFASSVQGLIAAGVTTLLGIDFVTDSNELFAEEAEETPGVAPDSAEADPADEEGDEREEGEAEAAGKGAVPFGPFIALAALEYLLFAPYLPETFSMTYLYYIF